MSPPTKGVTARGRARSAASADIDPRSPPDSRAFAHALLRRRKPVPSPAPRRSRAASDYSGSSSRHRANGGAGASATGGSPRAPQLSSPSDDLVSPASQAVARVHRHQDAGGGERLPVYVVPCCAGVAATRTSMRAGALGLTRARAAVVLCAAAGGSARVRGRRQRQARRMGASLRRRAPQSGLRRRPLDTCRWTSVSGGQAVCVGGGLVVLEWCAHPPG